MKYVYRVFAHLETYVNPKYVLTWESVLIVVIQVSLVAKERKEEFVWEMIFVERITPVFLVGILTRQHVKIMSARVG